MSTFLLSVYSTSLNCTANYSIQEKSKNSLETIVQLLFESELLIISFQKSHSLLTMRFQRKHLKLHSRMLGNINYVEET